jgi:four helix bundle suffix protein
MESIIFPKYGGYRKLKSFQVSRLVYDVTVLFCKKNIDSRSRTCDQMVQAARSGVQNIAEGSAASATSKKTEIRLTNVAKASLEELLLDYEDYIRQHNLIQWLENDSRCLRIRRSNISEADDLRRLLASKNDWEGASPKERTANAMICLINQATFLLRRQLTRLENDFLARGGFSENLYKTRKRFQK